MGVLGLGLASSAEAASVQVQLHGTATPQDDFLCWSPVPVRVRQVGGAADLDVTLRSGSTGTGELWFQAPGPRPTRTSWAPVSTVSLTLPVDGSWVELWAAGKTASTDGKDTGIAVVQDSNNTVIAGINAMVRVRKDVRSLTPAEATRILEALARLNGTYGGGSPGDGYVKYAEAHGGAFNLGIHGGPNGLPLFLAWHRAFLLSLERELQDIDPRVALPYWRFDESAPDLFHEDSLGTVNLPDTRVQFSDANPLEGWRMPGSGTLRRWSDLGGGASVVALDTLIARADNHLYDAPGPGGFNGDIEREHHNSPHAQVGGWLGTGTSPRDPLFFLLQANVDRAWAEWQQTHDRFDADDPRAYSAQGAYPGPSDPTRFRRGAYAEDGMWPWDGDDGSGNADPLDDWPADGGFSFPPSVAGSTLPIPPTPGSMVDYLDTGGTGGGLQACYDQLPF